MADEILPPSILYKRLYDEAAREGFDIITYNKIISFANSLNKADVEHFLWLADSTYPAYLKLRGLALSGNADAIEVFATLNDSFSYKMSPTLGTYHGYGYALIGGVGLGTIISVIMLSIGTVTTGWLAKFSTIGEGVAKGVVALFGLVYAITGFVDRRVNYNDRIIKLVIKIVELRLSGIKYLENIKEKCSNKNELLSLLNIDFAQNTESKYLAIIINIIFDNADLGEYYKMPIKENQYEGRPLFYFNADNGTRGVSFYPETEVLWDQVVARIAVNTAPSVLINTTMTTYHRRTRYGNV